MSRKFPGCIGHRGPSHRHSGLVFYEGMPVQREVQAHVNL